MTTKSIILKDLCNKRNLGFWNEYFLPVGLPLLAGLGLGLLLAALIVSENWLFALAIPFLIPIAILLNKYPFAAIMTWMAVMPWFPFRGIYKYVRFTFHRLLIPLGLGIILLSFMLRLRKHRPTQLGPADLAMVAYGAMGIISIFVTGNHWKTIFTLQDRALVPFMAYWLIRFSNAQQQELKRLIPLMMLLSLAECVIGLVSWFAPQALPSIWHLRLLGSRVTGTFNGAGAYGCILMFFMTFLYHEAMNRKRGCVRTLLILASSLGVVCIFFTFTRGVWVGGILALLMLLYLYPKPTVSLIAIIVPIMAILSAGVLADEFAYAHERLYETEDAAHARLVMANAGKNMFYARPVFGWGYENYDRYDWKFMERVGDTTPTRYHIRKATSHNTYLTILAEMGIVGFFLFYFPVIWWLGLTVKALPRLPKEGFWSRRLLIAMWLPIGAQLVVGLRSDLRFSAYALMLFWIDLGFIANMVQAYLEPDERHNFINAPYVAKSTRQQDSP